MTQPEYLDWLEFYRQNPFDDYARFYRPAALIANQVKGAELDDLLAWLEKRPSPTEGYSDADLATMRAFGMKPPRKD